jgi:hypothetical protein
MKYETTILLFLLAMGALPAAAQVSDQPAEVHKRNNCRLAAQVLDSGEPHTRIVWARAYIVDCEEEGPAFFSTQWASAPSDTASLRQLIASSTRVRDARVYAVLRQTVLDGSRPDAVRVAAMIALTRYVNPHIVIDLCHLQAPAGEADPVVRLQGGSTVDVVQVPGAQPFGAVTAEVLSLLRGIASARDSEPRAVWYAAAVIARRLELTGPPSTGS